MTKKTVYIPDKLSNIYEWQEKTLRIDRIANLKDYQTKKKQFLSSNTGRKFQGYKRKKFTDLHGLEVWFVDGAALRSGGERGDVDFVMGGHPYRYLYIPLNELWVDKIYKDQKELWSIIWHEYLESVLMANGVSYSQAHTIASRLEIVLKKGDYFILPVGTHRQSVPWTCGPAALKIVLDYLRLPLPEKRLVKLCEATPEKGTDPQDLVRVAEKLGFKAYEKQNMTISEVKKLVQGGTPVIVNYQYKPKYGEGHYAVIIGFSQDEFILSDPAEDKGYLKVKIKDFMSQWYELEDKTVRQGIVINR